MTTALLLALALAAEPAPAAAPAAEGRVLNRVAATVNGEVVTLRELVDRAGSDYASAMQLPPGPEREKARGRALRFAFDMWVAERLLDGQAAALGVEASEAEIDAAIEDIKKRNNLDESSLDQALASQGLDRTTFRVTVRRDIEAMRVLQMKVRSRVKVTDEDVRSYWQTHPQEFRAEDEVRVRHVFIAVPESASPADRTRLRVRAERVVERARSGVDFAALAQGESEAPTASEGGDLGWLRRGTVQEELERAAFALPAGGVSDVIATRAGFQVLKVEERRLGAVRPFDDVKEEIRNQLTNQQLESYRAQYVAELRKDAVVDVKIPELREPSADAAAPAARS